ncbi:MAG: sensor histidine kinase [Planctomycetaceae bacterium]
MWKTLRFRLAIWNIFVIALTALTILVGLRQGVGWTLLNEMDQILAEDAQEVALALEQITEKEFPDLTEELTRKSIGHKHHGWFIQLFGAGNQIAWASPESPSTLQLPISPAARPAEHDHYRLVDRTIASNSAHVTAIRVGTTLTFLDQDMARIDRLVLAAAGVVVVIAPAVGFWLAGRAARTIGEITKTASRLRPSHLEERLPIQGSGDELDQLAHTINGLLDRIAEDLAQKRDFLANAAHELRTPLAAIHSSVEVALTADRTQEEYQDLLVEIIDQGASLETLVNQLLLISESEAERIKMDQAPVLFHDTVRRAAEMFAGVAESRDVSLVIQIANHVTVQGHPHLLRQLVNNLLDNAIKYTPAGGTVTVRLALGAARQAVLTVDDTGIGIAQSDVPRVFDRFFRADASRSRLSDVTGTGLGLSICQAVAAAHRAHIGCESTLHHGSRFTVEFPSDDQSTPPHVRTAADQHTPDHDRSESHRSSVVIESIAAR